MITCSRSFYFQITQIFLGILFGRTMAPWEGMQYVNESIIPDQWAGEITTYVIEKTRKILN